jgi:hypothetical protein
MGSRPVRSNSRQSTRPTVYSATLVGTLFSVIPAVAWFSTSQTAENV